MKIYEVIGHLTAEADLEFSPDWTHAVYYSQAENDKGWKAMNYCLEGHRYMECGEKLNVTPPDPPKIKALRGEYE